MLTIWPVLHSVKTLKPVTAMLRELGVRLVIYILVMVKTKELAKDHTLGLIHLLENLGFIVHPVKSVTISTQGIEFLKMQVNSLVSQTCQETRLPRVGPAFVVSNSP